MSSINVPKGRTKHLPVFLNMDTSLDTITSQIRTQPDREAPLVATWSVSPVTDGSDGKYIFSLTSTVAGQILADSGYMDILRVSGGEELSILRQPIPVEFTGTVTTP